MDKQTASKTLENYVKRTFRNVSRNGDWINFSCPVAPYSVDHGNKPDNSPSAGAIISVSGKPIWKCFTCKGQGPVSNLYRYLQTKNSNVDYSEIIAALDKDSEIPEYDTRFITQEKLVCEPLEYSDLFDPTDKFVESSKYLADRGISPTTATKLGLGFDKDNHRIVFPVKDKLGRTYGFTGRTTLSDKSVPKIKDYYFPKSLFILGQEHWNKDYPVIIVEGLFAYAKLHEISKGRYFPYNIGAIMGSSASPDQIDILTNFGKPVICLLDNDKAGHAGMFGRTIMPDWSKAKREAERAKGMVYMLKDHLPTFIVKWPTHIVDGKTIEKTDPDDLTFEELSSMLSKLRLML